MRTGAGFAAATVAEGVDSHFGGDERAEFQRGAARRVDLVTVVAFENFDVGVLIFQRFRGDLRQFHRQINGRAHTRRAENRDRFRRVFQTLELLRVGAGRRVNERDFAVEAKGEEGVESARRREIDDNVRRNVGREFGGDRDADFSDSGDFTGVATEFGAGRRFERGDDLQFRVGGAERDETFAHFAGGSKKRYFSHFAYPLHLARCLRFGCFLYFSSF